jgi:lysophospholipase L1-like esterase
MQKYLFILVLIICSPVAQSQKKETVKNSLNDLYLSDSIVSRYHNNWTQVHYRKRVNIFKNEPLSFHEIVYIGNSITEKGGNWSERYGKDHIRNRGISGDVTDGVLKRLDEITHFEPRAVFILIGINDLFNMHHEEDKRSNLKYDKIVPSTKYVGKNILKIAKTIHCKSPRTKIYLQTILPTRREFLKDDIIAVNSLIKRYEKKGCYTTIDLYSQFVDEEGMMIKDLTKDGVHLNEKGYERWVSFERFIIESL